jgi:Tol biopolymer transport system component
MAQRLDAERLQLAAGSAPTVIAEGVAESGANTAGFSVSENGMVAYKPVVPVPMQLEWFNRSGERLGTVAGVADYADLALSRDGTKAAVSVLVPTAGTRDIWVYDVSRGHRERVTSHPADDFAPAWSPAGDRLVFSSLRTGQAELYLTSSSSTDAEVPLPVPGLTVGKFAAHWAPIGDVLIFVAGHRILARSDLWIKPMTGERPPWAFAETPFIETQPRFSPDGRWVAYSSNESGRLEVSARLASGAGPRQPISLNGGRYGLWRGDGTEIFFVAPDNRIMAASIRIDGDRLVVAAIRPLFRIGFRRNRLDAYPYAVTPDGQRFLVNSVMEETAPPTIGLIVNWTQLIGGK